MTQAQPGDEGRRQAYLAALGIPLWSARIELPGALPSTPLAFVPYVVEGAVPAAVTPAAPAAAPDLGGAAIAPSRTAATVPDTGPAATPSVASAPSVGGAPAARIAPGAAGHDLTTAPAAAGRPATPAAAATEAPRRSVADERVPRLSCRAWRLAPGLNAVIALDDAPDLSAAEYRLLDNIARALDASEMPAATGELLRWPLNRNPALDHGPEALHAWLGHALRLPPGRCVVFGEALAGHVAAALPAVPVLVSPTLGELLADAGAKRRLWQALHG